MNIQNFYEYPSYFLKSLKTQFSDDATRNQDNRPPSMGLDCQRERRPPKDFHLVNSPARCELCASNLLLESDEFPHES